MRKLALSASLGVGISMRMRCIEGRTLDQFLASVAVRLRNSSWKLDLKLEGIGCPAGFYLKMANAMDMRSCHAGYFVLKGPHLSPNSPCKPVLMVSSMHLPVNFFGRADCLCLRST